MAFKFTVDHTDLRIIIDSDSLEPVTTFQNIRADLSFIGLEQDLTFVNLTAANIFLDADSKDLFFTSGHPNAITISLTDAPVISFSKPASDTTSVSEEAVLTVGKGLSDTPTISESLARVVTYVRAFTDTPTVSESAALAFSTEQGDTTTVLESEAKAVGKVVDDGVAAPTTKTYTVTVATGTNVYGSGNKFYIDGLPSPGLILNEGITYTFDQSDSSNSGHFLRFSTTGNGTHNSGSEYTTDVTVNGTPGSAGAYTRIVISSSTPDLHYYCTVHSGMGAETSMQDTGDTTFAVTVATGVNNHGSGNKYYIDGVITPIVHLLAGNTYTFDQSDSSNSGHPFRFSETSNGSHAGGSEYTTGVTTNGTPGSSGAFTRLAVSNNTVSTLFYYCTNHSGMGGEVNSSLGGGDFTMLESLAKVVSFVRALSDAYTLDDTASASDDLRTDINIVKGNVLTVDDGTEAGIVPQVTVTTQPFPSDAPSISESAALAFATAFADSVTMSDTPFVNPGQVITDIPNLSEAIQSLTFSKSLSDSATISESLSVVLVSSASSVLNTAALNTSVLN